MRGVFAAVALIALALSGCVAQRSASDAVARLATVQTPLPSARDVVVEAAPARERARPCFARGMPRPIVVAAPTPDATNCSAPEATLARSITAELRKEYRPSAQVGRLDVHFGCGANGAAPERLVFETGEGHGFSLELWELTRLDAAYLVRGIFYASSPWMRSSAPPARSYRLGRAEIATRDLERELPALRALLASRLEEVVPPPPPGTIWGFSFGGSSRNFHHRFELFGGGGGLSRAFVGYQSMGEDSRASLPLEHAAKRLEPLLAGIGREDIAADAEDRRHFAESFVRASPHFGDSSWWWVTERYLELASELGSVDLLPHVARFLELPEQHDRRVEKALAVVAKLSGWDPRLDPWGDPLPLPDAVARATHECGAAP